MGGDARLQPEVRIERESVIAWRFLDGVDDQRDLVVLDHVNDVRAALTRDLVHQRHRHAGCLDHRCGPARGNDGEAAAGRWRAISTAFALVRIADADEHLCPRVGSLTLAAI